MNATDAAIEAATIETGRYRVARISGRYRVIDNGGAILATVASKAVGQKWIDRKVQTAVELAEQAVAERDGFAANRAAATLAADLAEAPAVVADTAKLTEQQAATITRDPVGAVADAIRSGRTDFLGTVGELLGGASLAEVASSPPVGDLPDTVDERGFVRELPRTEVEERVEASMARKGPAPEVVAKAVARFQAELDATAPALGKIMSEPLPGEVAPAEERPVNVYVGASVAELIIPRRDDADPAVAAVARKLADRQPNKLNYRHVKLSAAERAALAGVATAIENDATTAGQGLLARAARTLRARIAATV